MNRPTLILTLALLLIAGSIVLPSCGDDSCYDNGSSLPLAVCYVGDAKQSISGLTIKGIGVPGDSLLADSSTVSEIYLPLRASVGNTSYELRRWVQLDGAITLFHDTISVEYEAVPFFHSTECGAMYNFNIKRVTFTDNAIDSVVMLKTKVTNSIDPAMRIHFTYFE